MPAEFKASDLRFALGMIRMLGDMSDEQADYLEEKFLEDYNAVIRWNKFLREAFDPLVLVMVRFNQTKVLRYILKFLNTKEKVKF